MSKLAMNFTITIRASLNPVTIMPNTHAAVGSRKDRIIFKYPIVKIKATNGKATTVQRLVRGFIV